MIRTFRDRDTQRLLERIPVARFRAIETQARKRLETLYAARSLQELLLPGLRLEKLKGDRKGQYSIRVNDQYRICFEWRDTDAFEVEIVDYH